MQEKQLPAFGGGQCREHSPWAPAQDSCCRSPAAPTTTASAPWPPQRWPYSPFSSVHRLLGRLQAWQALSFA